MGARAGCFSCRPIWNLTCLLLLLSQGLNGRTLAQTPASDGPANFQGLYLNPTAPAAIETISCDTSSIFALSSTFAGCCSIGGNCNFPTACTKGTPTNRFGGRWSCGLDRECYTMTVYDAYSAASESWLVYNCAKSWSASTIYRNVPGWMTTSPPPSEGPEPTGSTGMTTATTPGGPPAAITSDGGGGGEQPGEAETSSSRAWIAGAVIGAVVGAAGVGTLGFWLGRRRRRAAEGEEGGGGTGFKLHSTTLLRSGGAPAQYPDPTLPGQMGAVYVAGGVEIEGYTPEKGLPTSPQEVSDTGATHAELESTPVSQKQDYGSYNK
ncbi:hypothetical protein F5144DRAFT_548854 [Chaetomium tenue]|uniref:Uncharacterized protein n=1 Tax=Chaetomium tenue TaxID=1854479 RepID=A0ACB7P056_9PEZI|nr:hypothetical protein F5144DRAFT_548854 [Chaetomium globosum]